MDQLHAKVPTSKVLLLNILPRETVQTNEKIIEINKLIQKFGDDNQHNYIHYFDLASHFETNVPHHANASLYVTDVLHLNENGYEQWYKVMEPTFSRLIV